MRAFRRPLEDTERDAFFGIYEAGPGKYDSGTDFEQGIALTVEAFLQSPSFLYRVELSAPAEGSDLVALSSFEIASRLSYMMWNSMPTTSFSPRRGRDLETPRHRPHARRRLADERGVGRGLPRAVAAHRSLPNIQNDPIVSRLDATTPSSMAAETAGSSARPSSRWGRTRIFDSRLPRRREARVDQRPEGTFG